MSLISGMCESKHFHFEKREKRERYEKAFFDFAERSILLCKQLFPSLTIFANISIIIWNFENLISDLETTGKITSYCVIKKIEKKILRGGYGHTLKKEFALQFYVSFAK